MENNKAGDTNNTIPVVWPAAVHGCHCPGKMAVRMFVEIMAQVCYKWDKQNGKGCQIKNVTRADDCQIPSSCALSWP